MLVVTTPTGHTGRHVVSQLLASGERVRVVARDPARLPAEVAARAEVVRGSTDDPAALAAALSGAEGVFWCVPQSNEQADLTEYYLGFARPFAAALAGSSIRRVVAVSSGGRGRAANAGPISALHEMEAMLEATGVHLRALRCGNFMENMLWQADPIKHRGVFLYPIPGDYQMPCCAVSDIATRAVELLRDRSWTGQAGAAVHGPADLSCGDMARTMTEVLGRPVRFQEVSGGAYKASLVEHGSSEAFAQGLVDMFAAVAQGIYAAEPRTPDSTTPTTFEAWCAEVLRPAVT